MAQTAKETVRMILTLWSGRLSPETNERSAACGAPLPTLRRTSDALPHPRLQNLAGPFQYRLAASFQEQRERLGRAHEGVGPGEPGREIRIEARDPADRLPPLRPALDRIPLAVLLGADPIARIAPRREHRRGEESVVALAEPRERPLPEPEQSDPAIRQPRHPPRPGIVRRRRRRRLIVPFRQTSEEFGGEGIGRRSLGRSRGFGGRCRRRGGLGRLGGYGVGRIGYT